MIQLVFQDPLHISNHPGLMDKLIITILQPALNYMKSLDTGALAENPLRTENRDLPPQAIIGTAIEFAEAASTSLAYTGISSCGGNFVL
jgi:hypothetical protein